jgi:hypothetical protein
VAAVAVAVQASSPPRPARTSGSRPRQQPRDHRNLPVANTMPSKRVRSCMLRTPLDFVLDGFGPASRGGTRGPPPGLSGPRRQSFTRELGSARTDRQALRPLRGGSRRFRAQRDTVSGVTSSIPATSMAHSPAILRSSLSSEPVRTPRVAISLAIARSWSFISAVSNSVSPQSRQRWPCAAISTPYRSIRPSQVRIVPVVLQLGQCMA